MGKIGAFLRLTRIEHSIMLIVAVVAAELIAGGLPSVWTLILSIATPALVSMGAFAINDYFDVQSDRMNKRMDRPIVSGEISKKGALDAAVILTLVGVLASIPINAYAVSIAVIFAVLAFAYSWKLKDFVLIGNVYIAFSMAIPFIYGSFVVSSYLPTSILLVCFVTFLSGLAREIHGMMRDREGDEKARQTRNLVHYIGDRLAARFAFVLYIEAIAISVYMFFYFPPFAYNIAYLVPISIANIMMFYVGARIVLAPKKSFLRLSRNLSLAAMSIALIAYIISPLAFAFVAI